MSLLLEALKKSDQQRREKAVPDLETVHVSAPAPRRSSLARNFGLGILFVAALVAGWVLKPVEAPQQTAEVVESTPRQEKYPRTLPPQNKPAPAISQPIPRETMPTVIADPVPTERVQSAPVKPAPLQQQPAVAELDVTGYELSMHYYVEATPSRLVRIDGALMRQGDRMADGTEIVEILPGGVQLRRGGAVGLLPANR